VDADVYVWRYALLVVHAIKAELYYKFTAKSVGERILITGQHLAKLETKIERHVFFSRNGVMVKYQF